VAFYDALAENESARQIMGDASLRVIAHELVKSVKADASVDWMHFESARVRLRINVKGILRRYGYPPDCRMRRSKPCCSRPRCCRGNGRRDGGR
jgi:type I restriction enzyme R subunit